MVLLAITFGDLLVINLWRPVIHGIVVTALGRTVCGHILSFFWVYVLDIEEILEVSVFKLVNSRYLIHG